MKLRPYQEHAKNAILREWRSFDKTLLVLPTGCGKTIVFSHLAQDLVRDGGQVLILAHRDELIRQAADKLQAATGLQAAVEKAAEEAHEAMEMVTVGSVQTMQSAKRLGRFSQRHFTHIVVDEAHHALSDSYQRIFDYFDAKVLGVTATPDRGDKQNLGKFFESLAYEYTLPEAIRDGFLSPIRAMTIPLQIDMSGVRMQSGDFRSGDVDEALAPYFDRIADEMVEHCRGRKTLCFLPLVKTSQSFAELLRSKGLRSGEVNGTSKDRKEVLADFNAGAYDVLCNAMLLTEGFDEPSIDCVVNLRPTKIRSLYCQMIGRGTRLSPGKENLLLLDFLWQSEKHELCRPAHLVADSEELARVMVAKAESDPGGTMELSDDEVNAAHAELVAEREAALAKKLEEMRHKKRKLVDPLQWAVSISAGDLMDYQPEFGWEMGPPSKQQLDYLENAGIYPADIQNAGMAAKMINRLKARRAAGFATPKQVRCLERFGFEHVGKMQIDDASKMITRIAANGWRVPTGMKGDGQ
ncbi:MAG: DEAD/DEAH box helicase [Spartobacteria bacterium]|nr:DEAD/DEAH box helicase [Spartobacteria bacterium]